VLCVRPDGLNGLLERLQGKDAAAFAASMENLLKQLLADSSLPFVLYRGGRFEWMVLLACGADAQGWIRRVYQQMNGAFTLCFSVTVSVGAAVGKGFPNAPQAASRALDGRFLAEEPAQLYFADAQPPEPPGLGLPPETEEALGHAMERGDAAALAETLQTLAQRLRMLAAGNAAYARGVWHETLFVLLRVLKGRGVSAGESGGELSARMDALERQTQVRDWLAERGALWIRQLAQQSAGQGCREVDQARALIAADLARDWSLRELAAQVALNESYLSALFSRKTGMSITRYTAMLRVEKAKALLRATDDRIGEIAARVGYADENYFCRIFKRMAGMTPNEYRRGRQREC
jgi:two-component system response regulator YesN